MDIPEEDKNICDHVFKDLYGSEGLDKNDRNVALIAFYCEKCLLIRVKSWPRNRYYTNTEFIEEFEDAKSNDDKAGAV